MELKELVLKKVCEIPVGRVTTYKEIAGAVGRPNAWRAVARILARNPHPIEVPCHRVVKSDGEVGGYILGKRKKIELLEKEGVAVEKGKVDLKKFMFKF